MFSYHVIMQLLISLQGSDDEPNEEKDRFVAQLYKFMDDRGAYTLRLYLKYFLQCEKFF